MIANKRYSYTAMRPLALAVALVYLGSSAALLALAVLGRWGQLPACSLGLGPGSIETRARR